MSVKTLKKYTKKAYKEIYDKGYKKVPKKKLVKQAASYGIQHAIGGPYLELFSFLFSKSKKKIVKYAGNYAYESFFRSEFAKNKINSIPITIFAIIIRIITNFLIFSRLKTEIYWLDFLFSIIVTTVITLATPFIYASVQVHEYAFMKYTNIFIDNFLGPNGWEYAENIKNRILFIISIIILLMLEFFDKRYLQLLIIHALITGFISGQIQLYIDSLNKVRKLYYGMEYICENDDMRYVQQVIYPQKQAKKCHTKNRIIQSVKPSKASFFVI